MADVTVLCNAAGDRARIEIKNDYNNDATQALLLNSSAAKPISPGQGDGNAGFAPIYEPAAALAAVQAGTHFFHAVFEMIQSGKSRTHTGGLWLHCLPKSGKFDMPENSHAILCVSRASDNNLTVSITPLVRANLLSLVVASKERQEAIKNATKKAKKDPSVLVPPAIEVPSVPPTAKPLQVSCIRGSPYKRVNFLMTIRGHRILFLEPPKTTSYINRPLEWEARLLYPNYTLDQSTTATDRPSGVQVAPVGTHVGEPVEGTHYTLLIRHSDNKSCCCGCCCSWFGSSGGNGQAKVKMSILSTLANTPAPPVTGSTAIIDNATAAELTLAVLALIPGINSRIAYRKMFVLLIAPISLAGFILFVINVAIALGGSGGGRF